jgi:hypothetical protein
MSATYPKTLGIPKGLWKEHTSGLKVDELKVVKFVHEELGITKTITLAGPDMMGAMCGFCRSGPIRLMNLLGNHYAKNKCPILINDRTKGHYVHRCRVEEEDSDMAEKKNPKVGRSRNGSERREKGTKKTGKVNKIAIARAVKMKKEGQVIG